MSDAGSGESNDAAPETQPRSESSVPRVRAPLFYWLIASLGSVWNSVGVYLVWILRFDRDTFLATFNSDQRDWYLDLPMWIEVLFAIAVISGLAGCVSLLARRSIATLLLVQSLTAVAFHTAITQVHFKGAEVLDNDQKILAVVMLTVACFLAWFGYLASQRKWI